MRNRHRLKPVCPHCFQALSSSALDPKRGAKVALLGETYHIKCGEKVLRRMEAEGGRPSPEFTERVTARYVSIFGEVATGHLKSAKPEWFKEDEQ